MRCCPCCGSDRCGVRFDSLPGNFHMPRVQPKEKKNLGWGWKKLDPTLSQGEMTSLHLLKLLRDQRRWENSTWKGWKEKDHGGIFWTHFFLSSLLPFSFLFRATHAPYGRSQAKC